jgi:hypothetical protein
MPDAGTKSRRWRRRDSLRPPSGSESTDPRNGARRSLITRAHTSVFDSDREVRRSPRMSPGGGRSSSSQELSARASWTLVRPASAVRMRQLTTVFPARRPTDRATRLRLSRRGAMAAPRGDRVGGRSSTDTAGAARERQANSRPRHPRSSGARRRSIAWPIAASNHGGQEDDSRPTTASDASPPRRGSTVAACGVGRREQPAP